LRRAELLREQQERRLEILESGEEEEEDEEEDIEEVLQTEFEVRRSVHGSYNNTIKTNVLWSFGFMWISKFNEIQSA